MTDSTLTLTGKLFLCRNKADANACKGQASDTAEAKCESKFRTGWDKARKGAAQRRQ